MNSQSIVSLVSALTALIIACIGAYKAIVADTKATANTANHATLSQRVHDMAVAMPAAIQQIQPQLSAVAALPQVSPMLAKVEQDAKPIADAIAALEAAAKQLTIAATTVQSPKV